VNYQKIHDSIIERSFNRTLSCYTEKHHIIPKCMGGDNDPSNIAVLTPEEHFLIHQLLIKIYPDNYKLVHACQAMSMTNSGRKVGAKLYGWLKRKISIAKTGENHPFFGKSLSEETRNKISKSHVGYKYSEKTRKLKSLQTQGSKNPNFGKRHSLEARRKMSEVNIGRTMTDANKKEMSKRMLGNQRGLGYKHSQQSRDRMSEQRKGEKHPLFGIGHTNETKIKMRSLSQDRSKTVIQLDLNGKEINRFPSIMEAQRVTGIAKQSISPVCHGKHKQAGGFQWKFSGK